MLYRDFDVFDDDDNLIEVLPAILIGTGRRINIAKDELGNYKENNIVNIKIQTPPETTSITLYNDLTNEIITDVNIINGKADINIEINSVGILKIRAGDKTITSQNEVVIEGHEN